MRGARSREEEIGSDFIFKDTYTESSLAAFQAGRAKFECESMSHRRALQIRRQIGTSAGERDHRRFLVRPSSSSLDLRDCGPHFPREFRRLKRTSSAPRPMIKFRKLTIIWISAESAASIPFLPRNTPARDGGANNKGEAP